MKLLSIVGYPIAHSLSPAMYNAAFPVIGLDAHFEKWKTSPGDLPKSIEQLRGSQMLGMCVTVPHKRAVMSLVNAVDPAAAAIGAVNCLVKSDGDKLTGFNTDKYGFIRSLREAHVEPSDKRVIVLGTGGAAHAVGYGLAEAGASEIVFAGRTPQNLADAAAHLRSTAPASTRVTELPWDDQSLSQACESADLIVNCTPVGMRHTGTEDVSPIQAACLRSGLVVCDTVYTPAETKLLRLARQAGATPIPGLEMLIYQAAECLRLWTGKDAPVDIMRQAARDALVTQDGSEE
jgi:shikimate dehydrogenase